MSKALSNKQIDCFWENGYLTVQDAVTSSQLKKLKAEVAGWVEESRNHSEPYGPPTIDGRPRFDMGTEHTAEKPALRRVNNPSDISPIYLSLIHI